MSSRTRKQTAGHVLRTIGPGQRSRDERAMDEQDRMVAEAMEQPRKGPKRATKRHKARPEVAQTPPAYPIRKMGNRTGYHVYSDGRIQLAPVYLQRFGKQSVERRAVNDLQKFIVSHCADLLARIGQLDNELWDDIASDLGIDKTTHNMTFNGEFLTLTPVVTKAPEGSK